jgi:hypothetical protein
MNRRALVFAIALVPAAALAQLGQSMDRPILAPSGAKPLADEAIRRTVTLILRAAARRGALSPELTDPQPLTDEFYDQLRVGARLSPEFPAIAVPVAINDRMPHARSGSIWASAGSWLIEVDPVRLTVLTIAPEVLPPDL